ncbi:MAG: 2-amino-4-hydroxy-6-hydroxymethyldihydropteridine diphosphokinase [Planctomycetaceae bacterium]|nr:2-amino-4-hydroxy-6-hydroxymethyldihydropteridine diphosphokinase [Planctomycetaceae bacterium]
MAHALVALGSNLGARTERLDVALAELARLPNSRLIRRSGWVETPPIGGPKGQGSFLNGAALMSTALTPRQMLAELQRIEMQLGRVRGQRWAARALDLDLLLFDQMVIEQRHGSPGRRPGVATHPAPPRSASLSGEAAGCNAVDAIDDLIVPHPRMASRRFVLEPAVAAAPWMVHPTSGWTVQALCEQLVHGDDLVAVIGDTPEEAAVWVERLRQRFAGDPKIVAWGDYRVKTSYPAFPRPKLILAFSSDRWVNLTAFQAAGPSRRMPNLPTSGPIAWIPSTDAAEAMVEAAAAVQAVWPELASAASRSD